MGGFCWTAACFSGVTDTKVSFILTRLNLLGFGVLGAEELFVHMLERGHRHSRLEILNNLYLHSE